VLLIAVLHFIPDDADPDGIVRAISARLAPGSYLALSHGTADHLDGGAVQAARAAYAGTPAPGIPRSRDEIERFLDGLELVPRRQIAPGRAPSLHVQNPAAAQLSEAICAAPKDDGFWFWWSWAEPIAQDPATTAAIIVRALRARPEAR
jgi:S-adenosyl methyltransferase